MASLIWWFRGFKRASKPQQIPLKTKKRKRFIAEMSEKVHDALEELVSVADVDQDEKALDRFINDAFALWEIVMSWQLAFT